MVFIKGLYKTVGNSTILHDINITIRKPQFVVILGKTGAGKTTLLRCIRGLTKPSNGAIFVDGIPVIPSYRFKPLLPRSIGMIFQNINLIDTMNLISNVMVGRLYYTSWLSSLFYLFPEHELAIGMDCLRRVGLESKAWMHASQLSGGERQRVGIARVLAQKPRVMIADEPVSSLDQTTARTILSLLKDVCYAEGMTVICSLHQVSFAMEFGDRIIGLKDGAVVLDEDHLDLIDEQKINDLYS